MDYNQGDIIWIDWRYVDKKDEGESKPRPCLVISNEDCHTTDKGYLIICPITSNARLNKFTTFLDNKDLSRSLSKFSEVRTNKIYTYKSSAVIKKHGTILDESKLSEILTKVNSAINN